MSFYTRTKDVRLWSPPMGMFAGLDTITKRILYLFLYFIVYKWCQCEVIKIGYITGSERDPKNNEYSRPGRGISAAITLAVLEINRDKTILPNHSLEFVSFETYGLETFSIKGTVTLVQKDNISVYIGPQETCIHEGRIAASFNIPMLTYFCTEKGVQNKSKYTTFSRVNPSKYHILPHIMFLLKMLKWSKVTVIYSNKYSSIGKALSKVTFRLSNVTYEYRHRYAGKDLTLPPRVTLSERGLHIIFETCLELPFIVSSGCHLQHERSGMKVLFTKVYTGPYYHNRNYMNPFIDIVSKTRQDTRIYIMVGDYHEFMGLLDHLYDIGLLDSGEYFVIGIYTGEYRLDDTAIFLKSPFEVNYTRRRVSAFRYSLFLVMSPPNNTMFLSKVKNVTRLLRTGGKGVNGRVKIRKEASYLYDAVWLYARVIDEMLEDIKNGTKLDIKDGSEVMKRLKGKYFQSAMGYQMTMNYQGDAVGNFSILQLKDLGMGRWQMLPIAVFHIRNQVSILRFKEGESFNWVSGSQPLDEPICGFRDVHCIPRGNDNNNSIVSGVIGGFSILGIVVGFLIYRNQKYEKELASHTWQIDYKDLEFRKVVHSLSAHILRGQSVTSASSVCLMSSEHCVDQKQVFTTVGCYKGTLVAIRSVKKHRLRITREIRKELKLMSSMLHDNINTFVGACINSPDDQLLIFTMYCTRGSLQDILENEDVQLDSIFIASLVSDIISGMIYLHGSEIRSHGKLKSSNCVVNSRWVLQITDFGLHALISGECKYFGQHAWYRNLLWCAPELLRSRNPPPQGTQAGDVYSFAIIMFEIHCRNGPFGNTTFSPKEIILFVRDPIDDDVFRPKLSDLGSTPDFIKDVIKACWQENHRKRPNFKEIRTKLLPMKKGMKTNIVDNMLEIMGKYADNLEALVQERTQQLIEEKKKTEELLYEMLPRPVAQQLIAGKKVAAEAYDSVTIYFSDICGFTKLTSESTPMQIIDFLNDLYTLFDSIIEYYDVYKVETIGDAYMVVSGLPNRNELVHAGEIASMSLHLLEAIHKFKIRHRPKTTITLRIGIHSGSCVAGVVGLKMPRYCLFGDTVNTASRMESNGESLKVHCSFECQDILNKLGGYQLEERGVIDVKGKGEMKTFWLLGEDGDRRTQRLVDHLNMFSNSKKNSDNAKTSIFVGSSDGPSRRGRTLSLPVSEMNMFSISRKSSDSAKSNPEMISSPGF